MKFFNGEASACDFGLPLYSWQIMTQVRLFFPVAFATPQSGWAVGSGGTILHTANGGSHWNTQTKGTIEDLNSATFASPQSRSAQLRASALGYR
jgi:hypothetical protein